jgi:hypothetical protein
MATYIQGLTDYIPEIESFQPDWGTIDQTMRLRQSRYDQGFASLQGTAGSLANLPLDNPTEIKKREKFMAEAMRKIGDLSSVDLSLKENVDAANNVFAPLAADENFLGNSRLAKFYQDQEAIAENLRQVNSGKDFSIDNLNYIRRKRQEAAADDSANWKQHYAMKSGYESYYDYNTEVKEAMAKFQPSERKATKLMGLYKDDVTDKSIYAAEVQKYLEAVLSDKAKRQMQIEASVRYGDPETLGKLYTGAADQSLKLYNKGLRKIEAEIALEKNPETKNALQQEKAKMESVISSLNENLENISQGNLDFLKKNRDSLAYGIYYNGMIEKYSKGFSRENIEHKITGDEVKMMQWNDAQQNYRMKEGFKHAEKLKRMEIDAKAAEGGAGSSPGIPVSVASDAQDVSTRTLSDINNEITAVNAQKYNLSQQLKEHIAASANIPVAKVTNEMVQTFIKSPRSKRDKFFMENYLPKMEELGFKEELHRAEIANAETAVLAKMNPQERKSISALRSQLKKFGTISMTGQDGKKVNYTSEQLFKMMSDNDISFSKKFNNATNSYEMTVYAKGKEFKGNILNDPNWKRTGEALEKIRTLAYSNQNVADTFNKLDDNLEKYFNQPRTKSVTAIGFPDDDKGVLTKKNYLTTYTGIDKNKITGVLSDPANDKVMFTVTPDVLEKNKPEDILRKLKMVDPAARYSETTGMFYINSAKVSGQDAKGNLTSASKLLYNVLQNTANDYETFYYPLGKAVDANGNPLPQFKIRKTESQSGKAYYLYLENSDSPIRGERFTNALSALTVAQNLSLNPEYLRALTQ